MSVLKSTVIASLLIPAAFVTTASPVLAQGAPGAASQAAASRAKPAPQYQYLRLVEGFDTDEGKAFLFIDGKRYYSFQEALNYLGRQGWELVGFTSTNADQEIYILKKEIL